MSSKFYFRTPNIISSLVEAAMTQDELYFQLEQIRERKNIPIDEFYPALGISKSTFHLWKRGAVPKSIEVFLKIYELLKT